MSIKRCIQKILYSLTCKLRKSRVSIVSTRLSGDGSFIDVRYWLSRPDKLQKRYDVYLLDTITEEKLYTVSFAKFGAIRTKHGKYTTSGTILFYNRNNIVKSGSKVILVLDSLISNQAEVS